MMKMTKENDLYMNTHDRQVNVVEQFVMVFDRHARAKEDHYFLFTILFQKREEKQKSLLGWYNHVALLQALDGGLFFVIVDTDV